MRLEADIFTVLALEKAHSQLKVSLFIKYQRFVVQSILKLTHLATTNGIYGIPHNGLPNSVSCVVSAGQ